MAAFDWSSLTCSARHDGFESDLIGLDERSASLIGSVMRFD